MYYEINVVKNGRPYFATAKRKIKDNVLKDLCF